MNVLVNYATREFARYRRLSGETARRVGGIGRIFARGPADLDGDFRHRNARILRHPRLAGYCVWKPYIIERALRGLGRADCLVYADAGVFFTGPVAQAVDLMRRRRIAVLAFANPNALERRWTKRDAFVALGCDAPRYADSVQASATVSFWLPVPPAFALVRDWLARVQDEQLVTDAPSLCGKPEYADFREHRHDQSLFSLLCKRHGVPLHRQPWRPPDAAYPDSDYPAFAVRGMNSPPAMLRFTTRRGTSAALRAMALATGAAELPTWPARRRRRLALARGTQWDIGREG